MQGRKIRFWHINQIVTFRPFLHPCSPQRPGKGTRTSSWANKTPAWRPGILVLARLNARRALGLRRHRPDRRLCLSHCFAARPLVRSPICSYGRLFGPRLEAGKCRGMHAGGCFTRNAPGNSSIVRLAPQVTHSSPPPGGLRNGRRRLLDCLARHDRRARKRRWDHRRLLPVFAAGPKITTSMLGLAPRRRTAVLTDKWTPDMSAPYLMRHEHGWSGTLDS